MIILQALAWAVVVYAIARFVNWLQAQVPEDCDVFGAIQREAQIIAKEAEGPNAR